MIFSSFKEINMDWNNLVGNFNDFALDTTLIYFRCLIKMLYLSFSISVNRFFMKKHWNVIIIVLLVLFFSVTTYSQSVSKKLDALEKAIEKTHRTNKQESLTLLEQMYTICRNYPDSTIFLARAIFAETGVNEYQGIRNSELLEIIQTQLEKKTTTQKEEVLLKSALACTYYTLGDFIQTFDIAIELLEQAKQLNDSLSIARALNYLGNICLITDLRTMGEEYYSKALQWAPQDNNIRYSLKTNLYTLCLYRGEMNEDAAYIDSLLLLIAELEELNAPELNGLLPPLYMNVSGYLGDKDKYYDYLQKALILYADNPHRFALVNNNLGLYYLEEKQDIDKALKYFKIVQNIWEENEYHMLGLVYENVSYVYRKMGVLDSALFYLDKASEIRKRYQNNQQIMESNRKHITSTLDVSERKLALVNAENELKNKQLVTSFIATVSVLIAGIFLFLLFKQKRKRMKQEAKELTMRLENEQDLKRVHQELLENRLREITSYSLLLSNKNQVLNQIKEINDLRGSKEVKESEIKKQIDKLVKNNLTTDEYWNDFVVHFTKVNPHFFKSLQGKFPNVTSNDLKLCAYIRMGMSTTQIAQMLNISPRSVDMNKYRLKKKLNLSSEDSLSSFLGTI
jgi:tetratricopeptide (TPR) repeat protein/DNA-binding CsgD family transcriptional regulator